ncbi:uncharacterized protein LOC133814399 [Humulus lupulus]|uniref:uncharacterized protein LOC133814399 n=1 Tax=Humulus lupulus TaxID=3486 RepID=UPI002B409F0E|nr:uncharacterized protein LOC133814399 [Humulus lupulus]
MQISITFGESSKKNKRVVTLNKKSATSVTLKSFKVDKTKFHVKKQKGITIHQNSDCLQASFEPDELTEEEQKMFRNDDVHTPILRVPVFDRLEASTTTPRVSTFKRLKNGQLCICVDYRDLNRACPKDEFPLPITELLVDATTGFDALSFMDGFSGYNQIKMAPEDEELTAFRTLKGIFCYKVVPFGLKNAGATYQRAMAMIFEDMLHNTIECYDDDLVVKKKKRKDHLDDLKWVFDRLRKHQLKMNPLKFAFGVASGKFLGFIVRHRGIEIDPAKIKEILEMPPPQFEINFVPQKVIKGQALADFLAAHPIPDNMELREDLPDEEVFTVETSSWKLFFDGAARNSGAGAEIVFVTPLRSLIPYSFHILAICTNNVAEYEALIIGLEIVLEMKIQSLEVFGDSFLVIKQMSGEFAVKHENLIPYH